MPVALLFEGKISGQWQTLGTQMSSDGPRTISHNKGSGREVYVTQCFADHATILRLPGGIDIEEGPYRIIDAAELKAASLVRRLAVGQKIKMILKPDRGERRVVRYRCVMMQT